LSECFFATACTARLSIGIGLRRVAGDSLFFFG